MAGKIKFLLEEEVQREGTTGGAVGGLGGSRKTGYICDSVKVKQQSAIKSGSVSGSVVMC